jgi:monoamine oxidase
VETPSFRPWVRDAIAQNLAAGLEDQIELEHALTKVAALSDGRYRLSFGATEVTVDHVVFALPFTTLRLVDLTESGLSEWKRDVISQVGYGTNAKLMSSFSSRVWRVTHNTSGSSFSDLGLQSTWDSARGQDGAAGIISGSALVERVGRGDEPAALAAFVAQLKTATAVDRLDAAAARI